jgi:hypothetical protein
VALHQAGGDDLKVRGVGWCVHFNSPNTALFSPQRRGGGQYCCFTGGVSVERVTGID